MKKKILLMVISVCMIQNAVAGTIQADPSNPATIETETHYHDGQVFRSFQLCQSGTCKQLGPASEYPVKWLNHEVTAQRARTVGSVAGDIGLWSGSILTLTIPPVGAAATAVFGVTGLANLVFGVGGTALGIHYVKALNPHEQFKRGQAIKDASKGLSRTLDKNKDVVQYADRLEAVLNQYGKPPIHEQISNEVKTAWNGAVGLEKHLFSSKASSVNSSVPATIAAN